MMKRPLLGILLALALVGAGIGIGASFGGDWGPRRDHVVVTNVGGDAAHGGQTIVVTDGGWHHGFPFGLLFVPFVVLLVVFLVTRRRRGCGPWGGGGGQGAPPGTPPGGVTSV
jgi:hypothetical protein